MAKKISAVETMEQMERDARAMAEKLSILCEIYRTIESSAQIDSYKWKEDEEGNQGYVEPDADDWRYDRYLVWKEVLDAIVSLPKKW